MVLLMDDFFYQKVLSKQICVGKVDIKNIVWNFLQCCFSSYIFMAVQIEVWANLN